MPFNMNKLTEKAQAAVLAAQELAQNNQHSQIEPEHLIAALLTQADGVVPQIFGALGANTDAERIAQQFAGELNRLPKVYGAAQPVGASPRLSRVLENSTQQASNLHDEYVSTEHLLLALVDNADGATARILRGANITRNASCAAMCPSR